MNRHWYSPRRLLSYALVVVIAVTALFPIAWMAISGFKGQTEVLPDLTQIMQYLATFRSARGNEWGMLMAGSTLAALPTIILVLVFQRYIVKGVRLAGLK